MPEEADKVMCVHSQKLNVFPENISDVYYLSPIIDQNKREVLRISNLSSQSQMTASSTHVVSHFLYILSRNRRLELT